MNLHSHMFMKALYSLSVTVPDGAVSLDIFSPSNSRFNNFLATIALVLKGVYWFCYIQTVIMNTSAKVRVIIPWPKTKALMASDQK